MSQRTTMFHRMPVRARESIGDQDHLDQPVLSVAEKHVTHLREDLQVGEALSAIRKEGLGERIVYFYVLDEKDRLVGVVPVRRLLTAPIDELLKNLMIRRLRTISHTATILEACDAFVKYKLLAFPIVDEEQHLVGVIDIRLLTEEVPDIANISQADTLFETVGFRISELRGASTLKAFSLRFPWLLATVLSGGLCAVLVSVFETTLSQSIVLAFFMTLALGLGESVSIQSMTVAIQSLRASDPTLRWYLGALRRELLTTLLLGLALGSIVAAIVYAWKRAGIESLSIGGSIVLALLSASFFGLTVPSVLHAAKLDPKIAAGPLTLALTDIATLLFYFALASMLLGSA
jgi:magnesium transporter